MDTSFQKEAKLHCAKCGGKCCKKLPGNASPEDFGGNKAEILINLTEALKSGRWKIDLWDGPGTMPVSDKEVIDPHFVRPACIDDKSERIRIPSWGGTCTFLTSAGCELNPEDRPFECRKLEPAKVGESCKGHFVSKLGVAEKWLDAGIDLEKLATKLQKET